MSNNQPQNIPSAAKMLEMAKLQIVAEAFLEGPLKENGNRVPTPKEKPYMKGDKIFSALDKDLLMRGNDHTSKLTEAQAEQFMQDWEVISYMPITATGFSGTLFRAKRPIKDEKGEIIFDEGKLVMSFRSTEFIDDAARDNQATNVMEIADKGWAFGQISDMEQWLQYLQSEEGGKLIGKDNPIDITGYSLGGHLATAFNILHHKEGIINSTYTFNGAGVGGKENLAEMDSATLKSIIDDFNVNRQYGKMERLFTFEKSKDYYHRLNNALYMIENKEKSRNIDMDNAIKIMEELERDKVLSFKNVMDISEEIGKDNIASDAR